MKQIKIVLAVLLSAVFLFSCANNTPNVDRFAVPTDSFIKQEGLAKIHITTQTGKDVTSKEVYIKCDIIHTDIYGNENTYETSKIRGRGNQSWNVEKKSYRLKLSEKGALISSYEYENKDWVLIASHADKSFLRNYTAYALARNMGSVVWAPHAELVDVYLNGKYNGVYVLTEPVEVAGGRIDISEGEADDIGFLFEMDSYATGVLFRDYVMAGGRKFTIHSEYLRSSQLKNLSTHLSNALDAVKTESYEKVSSYLNLESLIDMYLINEYMRNWDAGWSSFFMFIEEKNGQIFFGPPWDFDLSSGNSTNAYSYDGLYVANDNIYEKNFNHDNIWYSALIQRDWFRAMVRDRWNEIKNVMAETVAQCSAYAYDNIDSLEKNFVRWKVINQRINQEPPNVLKLTSCAENVAFFEGWIKHRALWLDNYYNSDAFIKGIIYNVEH